MCIEYEQDGVTIKPGQKTKVKMRGPGGTFEVEIDGAVFGGPARDDNRAYWIKREGGEEVMVPGIRRYAEKDKLTGVKSWETVPSNSTMEGILLPQPPGKAYRLLKVITQDAGPVRTSALGNDRMPIFHPPLESLGSVTRVEPPPKRTGPGKVQKPSDQLDLFGG